MRESVKICQQALDQMPAGPVQTADRKVMPPPTEELATQHGGRHPPLQAVDRGHASPAGEAYVGVESPRGELGFYVVSDGTGQPIRVHERAPRSPTCRPSRRITEGGAVADVVACIASLDPIMGEVDR